MVIENEEIEEQIQKLKNKKKKVEENKKDNSIFQQANQQSEAILLQAEGENKEKQKIAIENQITSTIKPEIIFDDFTKIDLKVGTIVSAEKMEKADKLLKLQINLGFETRTIVSGIALHFNPEELVGKQVTVVANLALRKMRGIESNGMILMAEDKSGRLHFINPEEKIDDGSGVS